MGRMSGAVGALAARLRAPGRWVCLAGACCALAGCRSDDTRSVLEARIAADLGAETAKRAMVAIDKRAARSERYLESCRRALMTSPARFYRSQGLLKGIGVTESQRKRLDADFSSAPRLTGMTVADLARMPLSAARARLHPVKVAGGRIWGFTGDLDSGAHAHLTYHQDTDPDAYTARPTEMVIYSRQFEEFGHASDVGVDEAAFKSSKYQVFFEPWLAVGVTFTSKTQRWLPCATPESLKRAFSEKRR